MSRNFGNRFDSQGVAASLTKGLVPPGGSYLFTRQTPNGKRVMRVAGTRESAYRDGGM